MEKEGTVKMEMEKEGTVKMEIERRFLLKGLPKIIRESINWTPYRPMEPVTIWSEDVKPMPKDPSINDIIIEQYYGENRKRYRQVHYMQDKKLNMAYYLTQKKRISPGVYEEDERAISPAEFYEAVLITEPNKKPLPSIVKRRFLLPYDGLTWEIDMFINKLHLIIAEVELPSTIHLLDIPDFIKEVMLMEVTDKDQFLNSQLAGMPPRKADLTITN